jgi:hypothetical protein
MSSSMETLVLDRDSDPDEKKLPMDWKSVLRQHFKLQANGCAWRDVHGRCRPAESLCCMEICEFMRRYGS